MLEGSSVVRNVGILAAWWSSVSSREPSQVVFISVTRKNSPSKTKMLPEKNQKISIKKCCIVKNVLSHKTILLVARPLSWKVQAEVPSSWPVPWFSFAARLPNPQITKLGRTALHCYSRITEGTGCVPFFKWEVMLVDGVSLIDWSQWSDVLPVVSGFFWDP